jgi:NADPH:quinone reductase-like Zn-dependent oxidoreductase
LRSRRRGSTKGPATGRPFGPLLARINIPDARVETHQGDEVTAKSARAPTGLAPARAWPDKLAPKPSRVTFERAAVVPYGGFVAWQAVHDHGHVKPGQQVLVVGASGAVGSFAVQLAKASGAEVTAVCSTRNVEMVRSLGADHVVDYTREDFADGWLRYDLIVDVFGRSRVSRLRRALAARGRSVIVGGEGDRWIGGIQRQLGHPALAVRTADAGYIRRQGTRSESAPAKPSPQRRTGHADPRSDLPTDRDR